MSGAIPEREQMARAITARLARGEEVTSSEYGLVRDQLLGFAHRSVRLRHDADYDEVVDASLARFFEAAAEQRIRPSTSLAYLRGIVRNRALDESRRNSNLRQTLDTDLDDERGARSDDEVARYIDDRATVEVVEELLRECVGDGDRVATRVINAFLNLAEELGSTPASRLVADRAGVSHTTVRNVLRRLRSRIDDTWLP